MNQHDSANQALDNRTKDPLLTVVVGTYNHQDYIERCLLSIAEQETTFPFEVIVGEDCSPDNTAAIIRALEPQLPDYFTLLYREKNMGSVPNGEDLYARARGKYIVDFEGDDFYISPHSLQIQVEFLEKHPEYSAVYAKCLVVDTDGNPNGEQYPACPDDEYSFREFFYSCLPGHFGTCVCRRELYFQERDRFMALRKYSYYPGDRRNAFTFLCSGKVRCIQEQLSAYRHVTNTGSSYCATTKFDETYARNEVYFGKALVDYATLMGNKEALRVARQTYYRFRFKWCFRDPKIEKFSDIMSDLKKEEGKLSLLFAPIRWYVVLGTRKLRGRPIDL